MVKVGEVYSAPEPMSGERYNYVACIRHNTVYTVKRSNNRWLPVKYDIGYFKGTTLEKWKLVDMSGINISLPQREAIRGLFR